MSERNTEPATRRRRFSLRKVLKRLLIVLLVFSLGSMLLTAVVLRVMFPRKDGDSSYRYCYEEIDGAAYPREGFRFASGDHTLQGYRYPADHAVGTVVVVNGIGANCDAHLPEILYFLDRGWSVVTWDATGVGSSEGRGLIGLQQIRQDLFAYLDYRSAQPEDTKPLVLYGHSAGGYAAATALDSDYPVDAAVCVCAFDSPLEVMLYHARTRVGPLADMEYPFLALESFFLFGADADVSALKAINRSQKPALLIESSSDDLVPHPLGLVREQEAFSNPNVRCKTVDSAWRNEHSTPWLSDEAAAYVAALEDGAPIDKARANELDVQFMEEILVFFSTATQQTGD